MEKPESLDVLTEHEMEIYKQLLILGVKDAAETWKYVTLSRHKAERDAESAE